MKKAKKSIRVFSLILVLLLMFSTLAACSNSTSEPSADSQPTDSQQTDAEQPGTVQEEPKDTEEAATTASYREEIVIGLLDAITKIDPQETNLIVDKEAIILTHNTLVFNGKNSIEPGLAESWDLIDPTTWEFKLRKGVKFHNGEELKASDVVFSFESALESAITSGIIAGLKEIVAVDEYTVRMYLEKPNADWLSILYDTRCSILNEKAVTELGHDDGVKIGTGAYQFVELVQNDHLTVEKFDEAWEADKCPTQRFIFKCIPENSARLIALQTGEVDVCLYPSSIEVSYIADDPNLKLVQLDSNGTIYLGLNCKSELFSNQKLRQAISLAVNRDEIIAAAVNGLGTPTRTWWANIPSRYDGFEGHEQDLEKAKELMAEAGYPDGFDMTIAITSAQKSEAEILQMQFKQIGINVKLDEMDSSGFSAYLAQGNHDAWIWGYSFSSYSDNMRNAYYTGLSGSTRAQFSNDRIDELFDLAVAETDETVRSQYYQEIQEIAAEECPIIPLYYQLLSIGIQKDLDGIIFQPDATHSFKYCYISE